MSRHRAGQVRLAHQPRQHRMFLTADRGLAPQHRRVAGSRLVLLHHDPHFILGPRSRSKQRRASGPRNSRASRDLWRTATRWSAVAGRPCLARGAEGPRAPDFVSSPWGNPSCPEPQPTGQVGDGLPSFAEPTSPPSARQPHAYCALLPLPDRKSRARPVTTGTPIALTPGGAPRSAWCPSYPRVPDGQAPAHPGRSRPNPRHRTIKGLPAAPDRPAPIRTRWQLPPRPGRGCSRLPQRPARDGLLTKALRRA